MSATETKEAQKDEAQEHTRIGVVIIAAIAAAYALSASAGGLLVNGPTGPRATHIAYMSKVDGEADIDSMTTEGFAAINLTHDKTVALRADSEPAWSPDGQYVAFQRAASRTRARGCSWSGQTVRS